MLELAIPGWPPLTLRHLVLDLNGTIAVDGALLDGVAERLAAIGETLTVHIVTADTHGALAALQGRLPGTTLRLDDREPGGPQKARYVE
ncbi:MAG: ATPase P, partial [Dehalococcoidia bacterium]|nr:ATPase P [Dehalococcoidia bacterium]